METEPITTEEPLAGPPRLRRSRTDRVIKGVCGGLGDYFAVDPVIFRVGFVALAFMGGTGLLLYFGLWLAIPSQGRNSPPLTRMSATGDHRWLVAAALGVTVLMMVTPSFSLRQGMGNGLLWIVVGLALAAYYGLPGRKGEWHRRLRVHSCGAAPVRPSQASSTRQSRSGGPGWTARVGPPGTRPTVEEWEATAEAGTTNAGAPADQRGGDATGAAGTPTGGGTVGAVEDDDRDPLLKEAERLWTEPLWSEPLVPDPVPDPVPAPTPRVREVRLGRVALSLLLIAAGIAAVLDGAGIVDVSVGAFLASALIGVGVMLVAGAWWGRARGLVPIGLLLTAALWVSAAGDVSLDGGVGERVWAPASLAQLEERYELGVGDATLDLRKIDEVDTVRRVDASVGVGELIVLVDDDLPVRVRATANVGEIAVLDDRAHGRQIELRGSVGDVDERPGIELTARAGAGHVEVRRAA